jgi:lipooligosaccharide transport system ATP-binding protein
MTINDLAISVENVTKTFKGLIAVNALSFRVEKARCFGLLGPNGAGKTTMMNMIYGKTRRDNPESGRINIFGHDPLNAELEIKFISGIVPQENNLDLELSVLENLMVYSRFYGLKRRETLPRIDFLLDFMELLEKKDAKIRELSGGMQRRLIIARALINSPKLLILDEPTTGLDPQVRQLIWDKLRMLKKDGVTILLTTHYMEEAFQLCDCLIIMHEGKKVIEGPPDELIRTHMELYVLEILDPENVIEIIPPERTRMERTFSRILLYSDHLDALEQLTAGFQRGDYSLRQSNLEDLYLKTTGRRLNEH